MRGELQQGHLGGDPAADGVPDDRDVFESQVVEQARGRGRRARPRGQLVRAGGAAEAGMGGREHPIVVSSASSWAKAGDRLRAGAAVQHQKGPPVASLFYGQLNRADARAVRVLVVEPTVVVMMRPP